MAIVLLALFPVLFIFHPLLGGVALVVAIFLLYQKAVARRAVKAPRTSPERPQKSWEDPWGTGAA